MPGRARPSFAKRQKEQARKEKQRAKLERRMQRKQEKTTPAQAEDHEPGGFPSEDDTDSADSPSEEPASN